MSDDDEDALRWGDEDDASHVAARPRPATPALTPAPAADDDPEPAEQASSLLVVTYGLLAGAYAICVVGWIASAGRIGSSGSVMVEVLSQLGEFLAIASPVLWFGAVFLLVKRARIRLGLLLLGLLVLLPVPFLVGG